MKHFSLFLACASFFTIFLLNGCASKQQEARTDDLVDISSIVVLPVEIALDDKEQRTPQETKQLKKGKIVMDRLLIDLLGERKNVVILSEDQRDALAADFPRCRTTSAVALCSRFGGDAVLICTLYRYEERQGKEYSIVSPASASFDIKLIHVATGRTLCSGVFDETQQAVLDNIFAFFKSSKRGFKWITAEALVKEGLSEKIDNCPYLKQ